jgi:lipid-binding SYLF domain-containing protein
MKIRTNSIVSGLALVTAALVICPKAHAGDLQSKGEDRARRAATVLADLLKDPFADPSVLKSQDSDDDENDDKPDLKPSHVKLALSWLDSAFPGNLILMSNCMAIIPGEKTVALGLGGRYGAGLATCRTEQGKWSKPIFVKLTGGELGASVGAQSTDLVLLFGNSEDANRILSSPSFKLGIGGGVAVGPGREISAGSNLHFQEVNLSYSHSKGVHIGISLTGTVLSPDRKMNEAIYGNDSDIGAILKTQATEDDSAPETSAFTKALSSVDEISTRLNDR